MSEIAADPAEPLELYTPRLRLRSLSLDETRLALSGDREALAARIGASVPAGWPGADLAASLPGIVAHMARHADGAGWLWAIIEQATAEMIGDIGFHSPLVGAASVEIGYVVFPSVRGRGYATEAAAALLDWALSQPGVEHVTAQIAPDNGPSLRVAAKLGMRETAMETPGYRCFERHRTDGRRSSRGVSRPEAQHGN